MLDHRSLLGRLSFTTGVHEATLKCSTLYRVNYQAQCGCSQLFLFLRDPPDALITNRDFSWAEVSEPWAELCDHFKRKITSDAGDSRPQFFFGEEQWGFIRATPCCCYPPPHPHCDGIPWKQNDDNDDGDDDDDDNNNKIINSGRICWKTKAIKYPPP